MSAPISRWTEWRGHRIKVEQTADHCVALDIEGLPYARLSCELDDGKKAPEGYFWLRWWSENQHLCEALVDSGVITTRGEPIQISHWVATVAARVVPGADL